MIMAYTYKAYSRAMMIFMKLLLPLLMHATATVVARQQVKPEQQLLNA